MPKDRVTNAHQGYGFVEFRGEEDADYVSTAFDLGLHSFHCCGSGLTLTVAHWVQAIKVLNMIKVYSKPIRVNKAASDKRQLEVGANLFIGNLDPDVDEKVAMQQTLKPSALCALLLCL
jgi:splicing factor 3B subunit 4